MVGTENCLIQILYTAMQDGLKLEDLERLLNRKHASVSAAPPEGNGKDEVEWAGTRFILYADRPDVGAELPDPPVPLLFKDWVPPKGPGTVFISSVLFPFVQWGEQTGKPHITRSSNIVSVRTTDGRLHRTTPIAVLYGEEADKTVEYFTKLVTRRKHHKQAVEASFAEEAKAAAVELRRKAQAD